MSLYDAAADPFCSICSPHKACDRHKEEYDGEHRSSSSPTSDPTDREIEAILEEHSGYAHSREPLRLVDSERSSTYYQPVLGRLEALGLGGFLIGGGLFGLFLVFDELSFFASGDALSDLRFAFSLAVTFTLLFTSGTALFISAWRAR